MKLKTSRRPKIEYTEIVSQISLKLFKVTIKLTVKFVADTGKNVTKLHFQLRR